MARRHSCGASAYVDKSTTNPSKVLRLFIECNISTIFGGERGEPVAVDRSRNLLRNNNPRVYGRVGEGIFAAVRDYTQRVSDAPQLCLHTTTLICASNNHLIFNLVSVGGPVV